MLIDNSKQEIGHEIDYRLHGNVLSYTLMIRKVSDSEWTAYKLFRSGRKVSLRKGNLSKIIDYMNRNLGMMMRLLPALKVLFKCTILAGGKPLK